MSFENAQIVGFRKPSRRKFVPRPLTVKLGDMIRHKKALDARRPVEEAIAKEIEGWTKVEV